MARKGVDAGRGRTGRSGVVTSAKRGGPGRGFWVAIVVVAVLGIGALSLVLTRPKAVATTVDPSLQLKAQGYVMGNPAAPVEILEFADFECPGCGQYATLTEPDVRTRLVNTGKARVRFLDFPLDVHKNTWDASLAASCANDQGKFWEMHDVIFANQDRWNTEATSRPRGALADLAKGLGLDMNKYNACMDAETHRPQIEANQAEGLRRQVNQTPTFVIGDQQFAGALPFDKMNEIVNAAIAKSGKSAPDTSRTVPPTDAKKSTSLPVTKGK